MSDAVTPVERELRRRLAAGAPLTFRDFMELALYQPGAGYYARPGATTGPAGDFSTSSDVSPDFGRRLAVQAAEVWERLGGGPWRIVELGPGRGLLAGDLLDGLARHAPAARAALEELVLVETSDALRTVQEARLRAAHPGLALRWATAPAELAPGSIRGVIFGNEVLDALPTHWLTRRPQGLVERYVALDDAGALTLADGPLSDPRLAEQVARYGLLKRPDDDTEVCLALEEFVAAAARALDCGALFFIDYGHPAVRLADEDHADGTLLAYRGHRVVYDLLARPGEQDLTAHVNWDHLADAAAAAGLASCGRARQERFLLALGLLEDLLFDPDPAAMTPEEQMRRLAARALIMPGAGGGTRFEVAGFVRGIPPDLRGFGDPLAGMPV
ncbi:MAG: SAM-dependent methyltransferase [Acidobacteria bacterium]|nr:SAM-dependent methyltransferase [Acidobacteriota bacterium]